MYNTEELSVNELVKVSGGTGNSQTYSFKNNEEVATSNNVHYLICETKSNLKFTDTIMAKKLNKIGAIFVAETTNPVSTPVSDILGTTTSC